MRPLLLLALLAPPLMAQSANPAFLNDSTYVLHYVGAAETVALLGDVTQWAAQVPFERVPGVPDAWRFVGTAEPTARLEYHLVVDGVPQADPRNPHRVGSGIGPFSEVAMPRYVYPPILEGVRDGAPGGYDRVTRYDLPPGALPYAHAVFVYTPPGYDGATPLPLLVVQDGQDYIEFAHAPRLLDHLITSGLLLPVLAVFVQPPNRHQPDVPNRVTEYGLNDAYVAFQADEVVPFVAARYAVRPDAAGRLVLGDSFGGLISLYTAWQRPDVFGNAYSQSGYVSFDGDRLIRLVAEAPRRAVRLFVDVGLYERSVGAGWLPAAEGDFLAGNRRLWAVLQAQGYDATYEEHPQGHTWGFWRSQWLRVLPHFFGR